MFTQGLSREVGSRGITVNNIQPGPIDTDLNPAVGDWAVPVGSKQSAEQQVAEPTDLAIISATCLGQLTGTHRSRMLHVFTPAFGGI